jgi:hypothetical protein
MTEGKFMRFVGGSITGFRVLLSPVLLGPVLLSAVLSCPTGTFAHAGNREPAGITVLVNNTAGVSPSVLKESEAETSRIFRAAGLEVEWISCQDSNAEEACRRIPGEREFVVHLVPRGRTSSDSVFGEAFLGQDGSGKYCDVFMDRIEEASRSGASMSLLLGAVAAHELGHLLLGSHSHSQVGIMTPAWGEETLRQVGMGSVFFTREQASKIQQRVGRAPKWLASSLEPKRKYSRCGLFLRVLQQWPQSVN